MACPWTGAGDRVMSQWPGAVARTAFMGTAERLTARRAYKWVLSSRGLSPAVRQGAEVRAAPHPAAVIASCRRTVRAVRSATEASRAPALAPHPVALGNLPPKRQAELFAERRGKGGSERAERPAVMPGRSQVSFGKPAKPRTWCTRSRHRSRCTGC